MQLLLNLPTPNSKIERTVILMTISEIRIRKTFPEGNLKAIVSATLDNCLAIHEIKIIQGSYAEPQG